eukprot:TRINITY_DN22261_c0_g1_i1.p1 TRINITY_DN22261_c0_g1~~TRINITY_DN22261_c0_g1_i1.p1  ORF type:complete len:214 (-),score=49.22 TRINITY_DN22261_c0_g1_i1:48-689(-)
MRRLFGGNKNTAPPMTLEDASKKLDGRVTGIDERIKKLDSELLILKGQMAKTRPNSPSYNSLRQRAMRVLKQRKMYEAQRDSMMNQSFNMEQANFTTQMMQDTVVTVNAMKDGAKAMKQQFKKINIDDVENLQDDMQDMMDQSNELNEILSRSYAVPGDFDETEFEDELNALDEEVALETVMPSYLRTANVPTEAPSLDDELDLKLPSAPQSV